MLIECMTVSPIGLGHGSLLGCSEWSSSGGGDPAGPCRGQGGQQRGTMMQLRKPTYHDNGGSNTNLPHPYIKVVCCLNIRIFKKTLL